MPEPLIEHAPRVRCYECGSPDIFSVCHHCQKPMCAEDSPYAYREAGKLVRSPGGSADDARAASKEFAGLKLGGTREAVYHCADHAHMVRGGLGWLLRAGIAVAVLGVIVLFFATVPGVLLLLAGAAIAAAAFAVDRLRAPALSASRPPLPLVPDVNKLEVVERLSGTVRLEGDDYTSVVTAVAGEIKANVSASDGRRLLQDYRRKYRLPGSDAVSFAAGFVMLEGEAGLRFFDGQPAILADRTGISLGGDSAEGHELFPIEPGVQGECSVEAGYALQKDREPGEIPLWIVPSLVPASDRRALEIDLHWNRLGDEDRPLDLQLFDRIALQVPSAWGNVESFSPGSVEISRSGARRVITWQRLRPADASSGTAEGGRSLTLKIRFERPITEEPEPDDGGPAPGDGDRKRLTLSGSLEATFGGMLSGLTGVAVYLPGGERGHTPELKPRTKVSVEFDISLRALRYQDDRVIPDENNADDIRQARNRVDEFEGVVPDYRTVAELTNAISAENYYVKSVVEHPPYRDDTRPNVVNRVWDVTGRLYDGVFPIDFDINLRGVEAGHGPGGAFAGRTAAQVTVKGAYAKGTAAEDDEPGAGPVDAEAAGNELLQQIEDTWTRLHNKVTEILRRRAAAGGMAQAIAAAADDVLAAEDVQPAEEGAAADTADEPGRPGSPFAPDDGLAPGTVIVDAEIIHDSEPDTAGPAAGGVAATVRRVADLKRRWQAADDAVVDGRITEQTHRRVVERIEAELKELGEPS